jgi:hypothetical protein
MTLAGGRSDNRLDRFPGQAKDMGIRELMIRPLAVHEVVQTL